MKRIVTPNVEDPASAIRIKLCERGVNPLVASQLASRYEANEIERRIEVVDWLLRRKDRWKPKSPAGYLVQSIRGVYDLPDGFLSSDQRTDVAVTRTNDGAGRQLPRGSQRKQTDTHRSVDEYIRGLAPAKRHRLEEKAIASASPTLTACYKRAADEGQPLLMDVYRRIILEKHLAHLMSPPGRPPRPSPAKR